MSTLAERADARAPRRLAFRLSSLSDRAIAWLFITPSVLLLLAINIFPLLWTIQLSFTNYRANRPNAPLRYVGLDNYRDILGDPDVWHAMQATAHFVLWSIVLEMLIGFGLNPQWGNYLAFFAGGIWVGADITRRKPSST